MKIKKEFVSYLESLGLKQPLFERLEAITEFYADVISEPVTDIFISEYRNEENVRIYESAWLFTKTFVMEAKNFASEDHFDWSPLPEEPIYWEIKRKDFATNDVTDKSRLTLFVILQGAGTSSAHGSFKASGTNCNELLRLFKKYFA